MQEALGLLPIDLGPTRRSSMTFTHPAVLSWANMARATIWELVAPLHALASQGLYGLCRGFLARVFGHQHSDLVVDDECRRKLELSSKPVCAYLALRGYPDHNTN